MSFNMRDYVSDDHIESIGEIAKSQSAIIQALSLENSKLEAQLQQKENIIKGLDNTIENLEEVVEHKENIIKEVREKIKELCWDYEYETYSNMTSDEVKELAELLDKENKQ